MYIDLSTWFTNDILYKIDSLQCIIHKKRIPMLDLKLLVSFPSINLKINLFNKKYY